MEQGAEPPGRGAAQLLRTGGGVEKALTPTAAGLPEPPSIGLRRLASIRTLKE